MKIPDFKINLHNLKRNSSLSGKEEGYIRENEGALEEARRRVYENKIDLTYLKLGDSRERE